jgi:hypothetical protein
MASVDRFLGAKSAMHSSWSDCIIGVDEFHTLPHSNKKAAASSKFFLRTEQNLQPYIYGCGEKFMKQGSTPNSGSKKKLVYGVQNRQSMDSENNSSFNHLPKNISESAEISCTHEEMVVHLSCDASVEPDIGIVDDGTDGFSILAREVQCNGTTTAIKGQRSGIFQSECTIQDKVCNGGSFTNAISSDLVAAFSLSRQRLPAPHYMQ